MCLIPSHVGTTFNEAVDEIVGAATGKCVVESECTKALLQRRKLIKCS